MNDTYETRLAAWEKARFAPPPEKPLTPTEPTQIVMVPMRDGVSLYTEIFLPLQSEPAPVVLIRSRILCYIKTFHTAIIITVVKYICT